MEYNEELYKAYQVLQEASGFKYGDEVKILRAAASCEMGWGETWVESMNGNVGLTGVITGVNPIKGITIRFNDDRKAYHYPFFILEKVKQFKDDPRRQEVLEAITDEWKARKRYGDEALKALTHVVTGKADFHEAKRNFMLVVFGPGFTGADCCIYCPSTGPSKENKTCDSCEYAKTHGICLDYSREPSTYRALTRALDILRARILEY